MLLAETQRLWAVMDFRFAHDTCSIHHLQRSAPTQGRVHIYNEGIKKEKWSQGPGIFNLKSLGEYVRVFTFFFEKKY